MIPITTRDASQEPPEHQDVLTYKPVQIKIIRDKETLKILEDANYYPIVKILQKGPMTVREVEKAYRKEAATSESYEPKSDKTIYRYLKILKEAGLVVPAGQRVIIGKTATETLYSRVARVFIIHRDNETWWKSKKGEQLARRIGILLGRLYSNSEPSIKCIQELIIQFEMAKDTEFKKLLATADEETLELITAGEWEEIEKILRYVKLFGSFLNQPDLLERLRSCFK